MNETIHSAQRSGSNFQGIFVAVILCAAVIALALVIWPGTEDAPIGNPDTDEVEPLVPDEKPIELPPEKLEQMLGRAQALALEQVQNRLDPVVDAAYQPAYSAIPVYADFRYSLSGQYIELAAWAAGEGTKRLEEMLLTGLDERLNVANSELDALFYDAFRTNLALIIEDSVNNGRELGPIGEVAIDDARRRFTVTAPIALAASLRSAVMVNAIASRFVRRLSLSIATRLAANQGGKWLLVLSGGTTGFIACGWMGPIASGCGLAGGLIAWLVVDHSVIKLDEYFGREEFEQELRNLLDELKESYKKEVKIKLQQEAIRSQEMIAETVNDYKISLAEFYGRADAECKTALDLVGKYEKIGSAVKLRDPNRVNTLIREFERVSDNIFLNRSFDSIVQSLERSLDFSALAATVQWRLPDDYRAERDVTVRFQLEEQDPIEKTVSVDQDGVVEVRFEESEFVDANHSPGERLEYNVAIEQHLWIRRNRLFESSGSKSVWEEISQPEGRSFRLDLTSHVYTAMPEDKASEPGDVRPPVDGLLTVSFEASSKPFESIDLHSACRRDLPD